MTDTNCGVDEAFDRIRSYARNRNLGLTAVATSLVDGIVAPRDLESTTLEEIQ